MPQTSPMKWYFYSMTIMMIQMIKMTNLLKNKENNIMNKNFIKQYKMKWKW